MQFNFWEINQVTSMSISASMDVLKILKIKNEKNEHRYWILHIRISLGTKFQLKLTIFIFWTKFSQKEHSCSEQKKMNFTIEFCSFELL